MNLQREALNAIIAQQGIPELGDVCPAVSLEAFFSGNHEDGSFAANLTAHPGAQGMYTVLERIRSRADVQDVLVLVRYWSVESEPEWPYSDAAFILSSASAEEVLGWWPESLAPDEILTEIHQGQTSVLPQPKPGMSVYLAWWD